MSTVHPIFKQCVAKEKSRYDIDAVVVRHGFRCATDGRICVREPADEPDSFAKFPNTSELPWEVPGRSIAIPGECPEDQLIECRECHGDGHCDYCSEAKCDWCNWCQGLPKVCHICGGSGDTLSAVCVPLEGETHYGISSRYLRILLAHGVKRAEIVEFGDNKMSKPAPFILRFSVPETVIVGLLMPMRAPEVSA